MNLDEAKEVARTLKGLLRVAKQTMPDTFFATDRRVKRAQRLLVKVEPKPIRRFIEFWCPLCEYTYTVSGTSMEDPEVVKDLKRMRKLIKPMCNNANHVPTPLVERKAKR